MTQNEILEVLTGMKRLITHMTEYPKDKPYNERWYTLVFLFYLMNLDSRTQT